jgi:hypothetical protein
VPRRSIDREQSRRVKLIGFSDIRKVVSWRNELVTRTEKGKDGEPVKVLMPRVTIVDADKISDEAAAAVAEVSQTVNGALRVKMHDKHAALVSTRDIDSVFGLCTILSKKREGATFVVHVECKGPGGSQMLSDVNFTPREDKTIDFSDHDQTYKAVLHRCPD